MLIFEWSGIINYITCRLKNRITRYYMAINSCSLRFPGIKFILAFAA